MSSSVSSMIRFGSLKADSCEPARSTSALASRWQELVERGHLTESDFRRFTCTNVAAAQTATNPAFFDTTVLASADLSS